ncbi:MAG TPA: hypothetical protein DEA96_00490, partial [Leptospiraceae bacterium]|nr:hypothetical protein [Leptospiraceae bacterium]
YNYNGFRNGRRDTAHDGSGRCPRRKDAFVFCSTQKYSIDSVDGAPRPQRVPGIDLPLDSDSYLPPEWKIAPEARKLLPEQHRSANAALIQ